MNKQEVVEFAMLKEKVHNIETKLDCHTKEQREDFKTQREDNQRVIDKLDELDGKFANKWVEKLTIGILITFIGSVVGAIIYLI